MRRVVLFLFAGLIAASAFAQAPPPVATGPSNWPTAQFAASKDPSVHKAYQVLNDMIRALGGDAYLNVRTSQSEGRSYAFYHGKPSGMSTLYWRFWEWPDKERVELTKQRDVIEIYNGNKAYEITYKGTATQDPQDVEKYLRRRDHSLEWVIRTWLSAQGSAILYSGTAMVERNLADQVTVLNASNDSVTISVDERSRFPVKVSYSWRDPVDRQFDEGAVVFSNYKPIQGVQTPFSVVFYENGDMSGQRFLTDLAPTLFEPKGLTYNPEKQKPPK